MKSFAIKCQAFQLPHILNSMLIKEQRDSMRKVQESPIYQIPVKDLDKELEGHGIPDLEHTYPDDFISEKQQETKEQEFYK